MILKRYADICPICGYRPCRCPWYQEDDKYDIHYDELMEASKEGYQ